MFVEIWVSKHIPTTSEIPGLRYSHTNAHTANTTFMTSSRGDGGRAFPMLLGGKHSIAASGRSGASTSSMSLRRDARSFVRSPSRGSQPVSRQTLADSVAAFRFRVDCARACVSLCVIVFLCWKVCVCLCVRVLTR